MRSIGGLCVVRAGAGLSSRPVRAEGDDAGTDAEPTTADNGMPTMVVEFSRFGTWYEVNSFWEGHFLERVQKGSFKKTIAERGDQMKVLFNHGFDFNLGDMVLGVPAVLEERETSPYMEVPLLRGVPELLVEGLRADAYGSSFMFEVTEESWVYEPETSADNPDGLPERTITQVRLFEAGPVTWPANPDATAGLRSGTDWLLEQMERHHDDRHEDLQRSLKAFRAAHELRTPDEEAAISATPDPTTPASGASPDRHVDGITPGQRAARLRQAQIDAMAGGHR